MSLMHRAPVMAALLAALAAATLWYALASATGLIFHFMPAAAPLAGGWVLNILAGGTPDPRAATVVWVGSISVALAGTVLVGSSRLPLDDPVLTTAVFGLGALGGAWLLRRRTGRT